MTSSERHADVIPAYDFTGLMELDVLPSPPGDDALAQELSSFGRLELLERHRNSLASRDRAEILIREAENRVRRA